MAQHVQNDTDDAHVCQMAIDDLTKQITANFPQYPQLGSKFIAICNEENYDELNVLLEDLSDGFNDSVILETIAEEIDIKDEHKESLCWFIHFTLSHFIPPPISLHLAKLSMQVTGTEMHEMAGVVAKQAIYFKPQSTEDESTLKLLVIGRKHRFPLVTFLLDLYSRYRLLEYHKIIEEKKNRRLNLDCTERKKRFEAKQHYRKLTIPYFMKSVYAMKRLKKQAAEENNVDSKKALVRFEATLESVFRQLSLSPLCLVQRRWKIYDSRFIFAKYYLAMLIAVDNMLKNANTKLPLQIDFWVIPKDVCKDSEKHENHEKPDHKDNDDSDSDADDWCDDNLLNIKDLRQRLGQHIVDNLITQEITDHDTDVRVLHPLLFDVCQKVIQGAQSKRMVIIIDRREATDMLYAYLPKNTQNIPSGDYLHESMMHLSRSEVIPSEDGNTTNVINTAAPLCDMCLLSIHIHSADVIRAYWYVNGTYTRWYVNDIIDIWPAYFADKENVTKKIRDLINATSALIPLKDDHFNTFFETNTHHHINAPRVPSKKAKTVGYIPKKHTLVSSALDMSKQQQIPLNIHSHKGHQGSYV
eukprot:121245_1